MTFDLYATIIILAVRFVQFLIGSRKRVLPQRLFLLLLCVVFILNTRYLMSQMNPKNKSLKNLDLIPDGLGGLLHAEGLPLSVVLSVDE